MPYSPEEKKICQVLSKVAFIIVILLVFSVKPI